MNEEREQRIKKLPKWAQMYIGKLQRDNAALRAERGKIADGDAKITFWVNFDEDHGIPDRARVVFQANDGTIDLKLRDGKVQVHASYTLIIEPASSNSINLSVRR